MHSIRFLQLDSGATREASSANLGCTCFRPLNLLLLVSLAFAGLTVNLTASEPATLRLAIGPFFAPAANDGLRQLSASLPELLAVELSHQSRFQLVEREKVAGLWQELHLSASGLTSPQTVSQLGRVLACDWLVTGSLVQTGSRTQVWTKVIDVKSSVVLDLEALPFAPNDLSATVSGIAAFLARAGSSSHQRQFIALGRFTDLSGSAPHEDWSRRVAALVEQHYQALGVGIVEREAAAPIFEEFQFDQAGLTGSPTNRIKLQPAFCIVDAACTSVHDTEDQVEVALRFQKVGGQEQSLRITRRPGAELERAVIAALDKLLAQSNETPSSQMAAKEAELHNRRGMVSAQNNDSFSPSHHVVSSFGSPDPQRMQKFQDNRRATLESFQKTLLLDPKNTQAKYMLGYGLLADDDPAQRQRGKELLTEVAALNDTTFSDRARFYVTNSDQLVSARASSFAAPARAGAPPGGSAPFAKDDTARVVFLQENFSKLVPVSFQRGPDSLAMIQYLRPKENRFEYEGAWYCGFQFTTPDWLDGNFEWMFLLVKTAANKDSTVNLNWNIIAKTGRLKGFPYRSRSDLAEHPRLKEQFPYTGSLIFQDLVMGLLQPGKSYAIWFRSEQRDIPDIAFAMTIHSERGAKEFGILPSR